MTTKLPTVVELIEHADYWRLLEGRYFVRCSSSSLLGDYFVSEAALLRIHHLLPYVVKALRQPPHIHADEIAGGTYVRNTLRVLTDDVVILKTSDERLYVFGEVVIKKQTSPNPASVKLSGTRLTFPEPSDAGGHLPLVCMANNIALSVSTSDMEKNFPCWQTRYDTAKSLCLSGHETMHYVFKTTTLGNTSALTSVLPAVTFEDI